MIKGTNANCKVMGIDVTGSTATVHLLVFATSATFPARPFRIALQNEGSTEKEYADENVYWIDRATNYDADSKNVDTNKYKEILIPVDITNGGDGSIEDWKWVRRCSLQFLDQTSSSNNVAWSSGILTLISDPFDVPEVRMVSFSDDVPTTDGSDNSKIRIRVSFSLAYSSKRDLNYLSSNVEIHIAFRHIATNKVLEQKKVYIPSDLKCECKSSNYYDYGEPVVVEITVSDILGNVHSTYRKIARVSKKRSNTFVKTTDGVKQVLGYFINMDPESEHEGDWL